jgi:hypothetical protein
MVGRARDVHRERNEPANERHEVLPQALRRLGRLVADQLLGGEIKYHLKIKQQSASMWAQTTSELAMASAG